MSNIIIPGGPVGREKQIEALEKHEMTVIMQLHMVAQRHDLGLFCARCNSMFQGSNASTDKYLVIECKCRELKADNPDYRRIS